MKSAHSLILLACIALLTACAGGSTKPAETDGRLQVQEISILKLDSLQAALPTAILIDVRRMKSGLLGTWRAPRTFHLIGTTGSIR